MAGNIYNFTRFRVVEFTLFRAERSESVFSCRRSYLKARVLAAPARAVRTHECIEVVRSDRQFIFKRDGIAEVYRRIDRRQSLAFGETVHQSLRGARVSVRIHSKRAESLSVRNNTRVILGLVAGLFKIPDDFIRIVLKHLLYSRVFLVVVDAGHGHYAYYKIRQFIEYFLAYLVIHILIPLPFFRTFSHL